MSLVNSMVSTQLKELVKTVRNCKTAAEERTLVARESAVLRNSFKEDGQSARCVAITKLLYFYILGYPAHFGQMECLKLVSSQRFVDKRIGYLGCMMLLDELTDVHVLMTNSLKNDLCHKDSHVQGLALCTLASICSSDMARVLAPEVERLLKTGSSFIKKKASLCAARLVPKAPELGESFLPYIMTLIQESSIGLKLCGCTLGISLCEVSPEFAVKIGEMKVTSALIKTIRDIMNKGCPSEHTVHGVPNPFVQIKALRLLGFIGSNGQPICPSILDLLAQVLTNTQGSKNAINAILYEAILVIFKIPSDSNLRVLAISLLGRFLQSSDKNSRYIALAIMLRAVSIDLVAVLRHRQSVFECARDEDQAIRQRAIELIFTMITKDNVVDSVERLLDLIPSCDSDAKQFITSNTITTLEKFNSRDKWQVNTLFGLLETASSYMRDDAVSNLVALISSMQEVQVDIVQRMFERLNTSYMKPVYANVACWCLGEYGYMLFSNRGSSSKCSVTDLFNCLKRVMQSTSTETVTRHIVMLALMKLAARVPEIQEQASAFLSSYNIHTDPELQQRSHEWQLLVSKYPSIVPDLFKPMPELVMYNSTSTEIREDATELNEKESEPKMEDTLLDLLNFDVKPNYSGAESSSLDLAGLFNASPLPNKYKVEFYDKNGVRGYLTFDEPQPDTTLTLSLHIQNSSLSHLNNLLVQISVPKTLSMSLGSPSVNSIPPSGPEMLQSVVLKNPLKTDIKLRIKIIYTLGDINEDQTIICSNFPCLNFH